MIRRIKSCQSCRKRFTSASGEVVNADDFVCCDWMFNALNVAAVLSTSTVKNTLLRIETNSNEGSALCPKCRSEKLTYDEKLLSISPRDRASMSGMEVGKGDSQDRNEISEEHFEEVALCVGIVEDNIDNGTAEKVAGVFVSNQNCVDVDSIDTSVDTSLQMNEGPLKNNPYINSNKSKCWNERIATMVKRSITK